MVESTQDKINAPWHIQAIQGIMAGCYVAIGGLFAITFEAGFNKQSGHSSGMLIGGAVFPMGLIAIVFTGANLFTGNCMYTAPVLLNGEVSRLRTIAFLGLSWLANFAGALFVDYAVSYGADMVEQDVVAAWMKGVAEGKVSHKFGVAILRGVGCNILVCLGMWQALAARDGASKFFGVWFPVFAFTALGFEHCIANMFYIVTGMQVGAAVTIGDFLISNEVPVTLGNFFAGFLMGLVAWLSYDPRFHQKKASSDCGSSARDVLISGSPATVSLPEMP